MSGTRIDDGAAEDTAGMTGFGYRTWTRRRRGSVGVIWAIARASVSLVLRRKSFWILWALALVHFLFYFAMIYMKVSVAAANPGIGAFFDRIPRQLVDISGEAGTYEEFMRKQELVTMLMLAFAGAIVVGGDHLSGGLTFYLSRRLGPVHYFLGKILATCILISTLNMGPALALYIEYGVLDTSTSYLWRRLDLAVAIVLYGLCVSLFLSLLFFALASWLQRTVPLLLTWAGILVFVPSIAVLLAETSDDTNWLLMHLWRNLHLVGHWIFGTARPRHEQHVGPAALVLLVVALVSLVASLPRLRAVKVVR